MSELELFKRLEKGVDFSFFDMPMDVRRIAKQVIDEIIASKCVNPAQRLTIELDRSHEFRVAVQNLDYDDLPQEVDTCQRYMRFLNERGNKRCN